MGMIVVTEYVVLISVFPEYFGEAVGTEYPPFEEAELLVIHNLVIGPVEKGRRSRGSLIGWSTLY